MSGDLDARFSAAAASVKTFTASKPVPNESKLAVYGLYKQATGGDVSTPRPGECTARARFLIIFLHFWRKLLYIPRNITRVFLCADGGARAAC